MNTPTVDYLTLMLANMAAGLALLGAFFVWGLGTERQSAFAPAFAAVGLVALATGLHMALTWPMQSMGENSVRWTNIAFGEPAVLFGAAFAAAALAAWRGGPLWPVGIYAAVVGLVAIVVGARILNLGLTRAPMMSAAGFILAGLAGLATLPATVQPQSTAMRVVAAIPAFLAAAIWAFVGLMAYWAHTNPGFSAKL